MLLTWQDISSSRCLLKTYKNHTHEVHHKTKVDVQFYHRKRINLQKTSNSILSQWQSWHAIQCLAIHWCRQAPAALNVPSPGSHTLAVHSQTRGRRSGSIHCLAPVLVLSTARNRSRSTRSCSEWRSCTWACPGLPGQRPSQWADCTDSDQFDLCTLDHTFWWENRQNLRFVEQRQLRSFSHLTKPWQPLYIHSFITGLQASFMELLQSGPGYPRENIWVGLGQVITGWTPFLSPIQQCQSTEGTTLTTWWPLSRSTQPSILCGTVKWVPAKGRWRSVAGE